MASGQPQSQGAATSSRGIQVKLVLLGAWSFISSWIKVEADDGLTAHPAWRVAGTYGYTGEVSRQQQSLEAYITYEYHNLT